MGQAYKELKGKKVFLRRYRLEDCQVIHEELGLNPEMVRYTGWNPYATLESTQGMVAGFMVGYDQEGMDFSWLMEADGQVVGSIGAYDYDPKQESIEIGYSVFQKYWGRGYGSDALLTVCDFLTKVEGISCLKAWSAKENLTSARLLVKAGFTKTKVVEEAISVGQEAYDQVYYEKKISMGEKKRRNHKDLHDRYKLAMAHGFYLEGIMLVYNLMEDRLISFLHYAGIVDKDSDKLSVYQVARKPVRQLLHLNENQSFNLQSINNKIRLIQGFMSIDPEEENLLLKAIVHRVEKRLDPEEVIETLEACKVWKDKRNTYVHGLLKHYARPDIEAICAYVEDGMKLARKIDYYTRRFAPAKGAKGIRNQFKLQSKAR